MNTNNQYINDGSRPATIDELLSGDNIMGLSDSNLKNNVIIMFERLLNNDANANKFINFLEEIVGNLKNTNTSEEQKNKLYHFVEYLLDNQFIHKLKYIIFIINYTF